MKSLTTIQVTFEEDKEIAMLKKKLDLPSKKAVVLEGIQLLKKLLRDQKRRKRFQFVSRLVRKESTRLNQEWASLSTATKSL